MGAERQGEEGGEGSGRGEGTEGGASVVASVGHCHGCSDGGWVGVLDGFPHTQQLAAGLLYTVAQVVYGTQSVPALPGPSTLPVHSEPAAKFPFAQWPPDAYVVQVQP